MLALAISWLLIGAVFFAGACAEILPNHRRRRSDLWQMPAGAMLFLLLGPTVCATWQLGTWKNERRAKEQPHE